MQKITLFIGTLLSITGVAGFLASGSTAKTALIPLFFGLPILLCGGLALKPSRRKAAMHGVALLALLGFIGAAMRIPKLGPDSPAAQVMSIWTMTVLCFMLTGLCVRSFIEARKG
jgi:O-antigen ligase